MQLKNVLIVNSFFLHIIIQDVQTVGKSWKKHLRLGGELCCGRSAGSKLKAVYWEESLGFKRRKWYGTDRCD